MAESARLLFGDIDAEFLSESKQALENFGCFDTHEIFTEVFTRSVDLVLRYNATPQTLHLYLNELTLENGLHLDDSQLEFLYLQVLRYFAGNPFVEMTPDGRRGIFRVEWSEEWISCAPCPCKPLESICDCDLDAKIDEDDSDCDCHLYPYRNLNHLIHPFIESGDFSYLKRRLELLPSNQEKLRLLIEEKTEYEQEFGVGNDVERHGMVWPGFSRKCDLEIAKCKDLAELETGSNTAPELGLTQPETIDEDEPEQLKRRVIILLIEELIPKFSELVPAQKAEFLALISGMTKKGFENIVGDHRYASNFKRTQKTAADWLEKLK
ncbi:MAG: hypothetical protein ABIR33_08650 [Pyrinomonadaceae bacterium]